MSSNTSHVSHFRDLFTLQDEFYKVLLLQPVAKCMNISMPNQTNSKRISISLNPDLYSLISDLADFHNKPMSRVVVELLEQMEPMLQAQNNAFKAINSGLDPNKALLAMFASGLSELGEFGDDLKEVIQKND